MILSVEETDSNDKYIRKDCDGKCIDYNSQCDGKCDYGQCQTKDGKCREGDYDDDWHNCW